MERIKYISNKELLAEIDRSKRLFCWFDTPEHARFDAIVHDVRHITPAFVEATRLRRVAALAKQAGAEGAAGARPTEPAEVVFRVMTGEHVPTDPSRRRRPKGPGDEGQARCPFPPYKHYVVEDGAPREVGRSHWKGDPKTGRFCVDHARMSNRLALMLMLLVDRFAKRGNWRGYSYVDEMKSQALVQLSQVALQFDESKSDNPFSFLTQVVKNSFTRVLNVERKNQHIRDDLLIMAGAQPSYGRQVLDQSEQRAAGAPTHGAEGEKPEAAPARSAPSPQGRNAGWRFEGGGGQRQQGDAAAGPKKRGRKRKGALGADGG